MQWGEKQQFIKMTAISVDNDTNTVATGTIDEKENFHLTEKIFFKGNVFLTAKDKFMRFQGSVKIESKNPFFAEAWFEFDRVVNPDSVFIPIQENPKDPKGHRALGR